MSMWECVFIFVSWVGKKEKVDKHKISIYVHLFVQLCVWLCVISANKNVCLYVRQIPQNSIYLYVCMCDILPSTNVCSTDLMKIQNDIYTVY